MSLHIGIDGNEANILRRVGSNHFAYHLIKSFYKYSADLKFTVYLKDDPVEDMPGQNSNWRYRIIRPGKLWTQWRLPLDLYLGSDRPQVFFTPGHYAPRFSPIPTVVTVLDLAFIKYPDLFLRYKRGVSQLTQWTDYSVRQASRVIAISEATKRDLVEHYGISSKIVSVAYPGIDITRYKPATARQVKKTAQKYHLGGKYILYVGTIQPRKNLTRLLKAFERLDDKYSDYKLVIAGAQGWMTQDFSQELNRSPKKSQIVLTGFVDQEDIASLYTGADCLCLVGLYEGFGIPPAEALACGTIPVVSEVSSLPEVVGDGGIKVDPFSVSSIREGITRALSMPDKERKMIITAGQKHIQSFSWDKSAKLVLEELDAIAI